MVDTATWEKLLGQDYQSIKPPTEVQLTLLVTFIFFFFLFVLLLLDTFKMLRVNA